jgi:SpoVK/Ycf46/Vps4 family AAA+-type ATPase
VERLEIFEDGLIEIVEDELIQDNRDSLIIALTEKGKHFFFEDQAISPSSFQNKKDINLLHPRKIKEVKLFYSGELERDIQILEKLLGKDSLEVFFGKMEKRNLPSCLSVLLSGGPGTGKTELVLQMARKSGRQILRVDLSAIKDKYVGESEKNVRAIFKSYEEAVRSSKLTPILLLNEADGLLGKRREVNSAADQMLNTMQAILLEQMESMKGIIIATTNLRSHFDDAFDRRFTFKLEFENPAERARLEILNSLIPEVDESWRKTLAADYELSGGQWRNVVYRAFIEEAMGQELSLKLLQRLAESECGKKKNVRPIGF